MHAAGETVKLMSTAAAAAAAAAAAGTRVSVG